MAIMLMLPGSPIPDWLLFLSPLVVLVALMYGGEWMYRKVRQRFFLHKHAEHTICQDDNAS